MKRRPFGPSAVVELTHARLTLDIERYLRLAGWFVLVLPRGGVRGEPGAPDLLAFRARRCVFIEVKVGRDKLSADQERVRESVTAQGFEFLEARSLDDVMRM